MSNQEGIRSIHLLSDEKFIPWIKNTFSLSSWTCFYIILNHRKKKHCSFVDDSMLEVSDDQFGLKTVYEYLHKNDIVFHYFLDNKKAEIIAQSPEHLVHCWCFYGAEIYQQTSLFRKDLYGPQTRRLLNRLPEIRYRYDLRKLYYKYLLFRQSPIQSLKKAIPRVHAILWYVEDEIDFINTRIKLPPWQFFQFFSFSDIIPANTQRTNLEGKKILIGNSATIENNHADVLPLLQKIKDREYTFSLPMTYGQFSRYKSKIKSVYKASLKDRVDFLEEHLDLATYYKLLQEHPTAVFLHHRQQGLGNILYMLYTGTKIYLSKNNVIYSWLSKNDIKVFKFEEDFEADANHNQLTLDPKEVVENQENVRRLLSHNRNNDTLNKLEQEVISIRKKRES